MKPFRDGIAPIHNELKGEQDYALHGDVIIEKIKDLPIDFDSMSLDETGTLAEGEATLHYHRLFDGEFELRESKDRKKFLKVISPVNLKHQEHLPIVIPPGNYRIGIQREYDPFTKRIREVAD